VPFFFFVIFSLKKLNIYLLKLALETYRKALYLIYIYLYSLHNGSKGTESRHSKGEKLNLMFLLSGVVYFVS